MGKSASTPPDGDGRELFPDLDTSKIRAQFEVALPAPARVPSDVSGAVPTRPRESVEADLDTNKLRDRTSFPSLPPAVAKFGRYEVLGRLAVGGMAEIFLGRETNQGAVRHVALKVLHSEERLAAQNADFEALFLSEGRVAMQLSHPNISTVHEFGKWCGHFFIAMEFVEGVSLKEIADHTARTGQPMPLPLAVSIMADVAGALDYAHHARDARRVELGVVHRDVTPHNIMVRLDGVVKLLDFGVAKVAKTDEPRDPEGEELLLGKFAYMSPEQCTARPLDGRSDLFAFGVCLFELLTGERLYQRAKHFDTLQAIVNAEPPSIRSVRPELPASLEPIVARLLAKTPEQRYQRGSQVQQALAQWLADEGEAVHTARISEYVSKAFPEFVLAGRKLDARPQVVGRLQPRAEHPTVSSSDVPPAMPDGAVPAAILAPAENLPSEAPRRVSPWGIAAVALLVGLAWGWWASQSQPEAPPPHPATPVTEPTSPSSLPDDHPSPAADNVRSERRAAGPPAVAPPLEAKRAGAAPGASDETVDPPGTPEAPLQDGADRKRRKRRTHGFMRDPGF